MRSVVGWVVAASLAVASATAAADDARAWLERMSQALEQETYTGIFVHMHDGGPETLKVVHRVKGNRISERLVSLDGSGREIIRDNDKVKCVLPNERTVVVERRPDQTPLRATLPRYDDSLDAYYHIVAESRARVINRDAQVVAVRPRDGFRYGYRLWLDVASGLPLRSDLVNESGDVVERIVFTSLTVGGDIPDAELAPSIAPGEDYAWFVEGDEPSPAKPPAGPPVTWEASELPPGFILSTADRKRLGGTGSQVEHHVYTDGLASVSVFVESRQAGETPMEGVSTIGAANAFATTVKNHQVTVVGEVPVNTVRLIGNSLQPRSPQRR